MRPVNNGMTPEAALARAVELIGGPAATGRLFGISGQAVSQWRVAPANRVLGIEAAQEEVDRYDLAPSIYGERPSSVAEADAPGAAA